MEEKTYMLLLNDEQAELLERLLREAILEGVIESEADFKAGVKLLTRLYDELDR